MSLIADIFRKLRSANNMVRKMSKNPRLRTPFDTYTEPLLSYFLMTWGNRIRICLSQLYLES